jgi:biotin carboxylase
MRVLLLLPTNTYRAEDFLAAAKSLQAEVITASDREHVMDHFYRDRTMTLDFDDPGASAEKIALFAKDRPLSAVIGVDDRTVIVAAAACARLGLPHNPTQATRIAGNKALLRETLNAHQVPTPLATIYLRSQDPAAIAQEITFPCVVKPLILSASRGVIRADDVPSFISAFARVRKILDDPALSPRGEAREKILVEPFIEGVEVAVEAILQDHELTLLALFDKPDPLDGPFFEETLYITPSRLPQSTQNDIFQTLQRAVQAIGLREGPIHAELRVNERGVFVLEVAARSIGGLCGRTLRFGTGLRLEELILRRAMGLPLSLQRETAAAGVMMLPIPKAGILRAITGLEEAQGTPGIDELVISRPIGQEVVPLPEGASYLGFLFARGDTPDIVEASLRSAHQKLHFEIEAHQ